MRPFQFTNGVNRRTDSRSSAKQTEFAWTSLLERAKQSKLKRETFGMADIFDIANLITTVGVDAVKIKREPGVPEKSSNEILTELFSTFDADEATASPAEENVDKDDAPDASNIAVKKKKKSKKKHKHKDKKHKKKGRHNSSASDSENDDGGKKKKKHKKKSKRRRESRSSDGSDSDAPDAKKQKTNSEHIECGTQSKEAHSEVASYGKTADKEGNDELKLKLGTSSKEIERSPKLPPMTKKGTYDDDDDNAQGLGIPRLLANSKLQRQGKILIKNLKNSAVYSETVREIETKEKEKAARMEDGEISDSSSYNRTPTLSPTPPPLGDPLAISPTSSQVSYGKRNRTLSPVSGGRIKTDLRLILKEKEKNKLGVSRKDGQDSRDTRSKGNRDYQHKDSRYKGNSARRSQSRDRKGLESSTHSSRHRSRSGGRESRRRSSERRDRSGDKRIERSRERRKYNKDDADGDGGRSEDRYRDKHGRPRSRSKERKERIEIDKKKLLEIARRNAINMIKQGALPLAQQDKAIAAIQAGGKTVDELTDFCKSLSKSEAMGELSSISSEDDGNGSEKGFHHPFVLRERPTSIIMNIKDAKQLPNKTFQEKTAESSTQLRLQFPVSSGQHHRKTEVEWIPVVPKKPEPKKTFVPATNKPTAPTFAILPPIAVSVPPVAAPAPVPAPSAVPPPPVSTPQPPVFPHVPSSESVDIGSIVSQRLAAMRRLRENPNDVEALSEMYHAQNGMKNWAESKQMPGQFTGSTGVKVLSPAELHSGYQAWARKDQLVTAAPVSGGMGMALLQKMGWRPGEGLGKNKEGTLVPLQLEVKLDKRGLVSDQDVGQKPGKAQKPVVPMIKTLEGKHPVSLLGEYCSKRKLGAPVYELCFECGPDHKKNFLFKVKVNGIEYKPTVASPNKKQAKAEAAQICLQTLGLLVS